MPCTGCLLIPFAPSIASKRATRCPRRNWEWDSKWRPSTTRAPSRTICEASRSCPSTWVFFLLSAPVRVYSGLGGEAQLEEKKVGLAAERKERSRRSSNSWEHHVEVLVVADTKMHEYHWHNLDSYILTLFSTVASIYRHQSLRAAINIVVVRIIVLKHEHVSAHKRRDNSQSGPRVTSNAQETLQHFCEWQQLYNDRNDDSANHHDVAILLTRGDICRCSPTCASRLPRAPGKCDTLGLAELGTMCEAAKSCAIIEDNGLSAAFTIAHELGHM